MIFGEVSEGSGVCMGGKRVYFIISMSLFIINVVLFSLGVLGIVESDLFLLLILVNLVVGVFLTFFEKRKFKKVILFILHGLTIFLIVSVFLLTLYLLKSVI